MNRGSIARAALMVTVFTLVSRVLGFLREALLANEFGTSAAADVFSTSLMLVNSVAAILAYTMVTVIIPAIEHERAERDDRSAWQLVWAVGTWVTIILIAVGSVVSLWPSLVVRPFGMGPERSAMLTDLVRIMAPALVLQGMTGLLTAVLQANRRFLGPAVVGIAFNLGIILALLLAGGVYAASWGVVAGAVAQVAFQMPQLVGVIRAGGVLRPRLTHVRMGAVLAATGPIAAVSVLQQINAFSDKYFAAPLEDGQIAALSWAQAAGSLPRTAFLMPLLAPLFPVIARLAAQRRHEETASAFHRAAGVLSLVSLPLGAAMFLYSTEIAQLLFGRGRCDAACVSDIAGPLRYLALATWAAFLGYLLNRTLSALNAQRNILNSMATSVAVVIGLDIVLVGPMGISGLALASATGVYVSTLLSFVQMRRVLTNLRARKLVVQQVRLVGAIAVAVAAAWLANRVMDTGGRSTSDMLLPLAGKLAIGGVVFLVALQMLAPAVLRDGVVTLRSTIRRGERTAT